MLWWWLRRSHSINPRARAKAINRLGQYLLKAQSHEGREARVFDTLLEALNDSAVDVYAVFSLGKLRDPRAVPALMGALNTALKKGSKGSSLAKGVCCGSWPHRR